MTMVMMMTAKPSKYLNKLLVNVTLDFQTNVEVLNTSPTPPLTPCSCRRRRQGCFPFRMENGVMGVKQGKWPFSVWSWVWVDGSGHCCENTKDGLQCRYCTKIAHPAFRPFSYLYLIDLSGPWAPSRAHITMYRTFNTSPLLFIMTFWYSRLIVSLWPCVS